MDPETHGRKASGAAKNTGGGRHGVGREVESPQDDSTPREAEGTRRDETLGALTAYRHQGREDGPGRGEGDENPPTAQATRGQGPDIGNGAARRGRTVTPSEDMETAALGTRQSTLTEQTAPQPKTASTRAASTTMWRQRRCREVRPAREPTQERTTMGPWRTAQAG